MLDAVRHTSNSAENLLSLNYGGAQYYQDVPYAIADRRVITAPGTAPVSFMAAILSTLGLGMKTSMPTLRCMLRSTASQAKPRL